MPDSPLLQLSNTFRAFYGAFHKLHSIQKEAIPPILKGHDIILQSATGSGKSQAVLAPCLERVINSGKERAVLYIIPTRALAMDLIRRFEFVISERLGLNLGVRTGDIKRAGGRCPDIIFTTPESLDVMLGSTNKDLKAFLFRVETIVIDEVHPLIHQYRGRHLAYLFNRLERKTGRPLQKIAMSATIAGINPLMDFFDFQKNTHHIITSVKRNIAARLIHIKQLESEIPALLNDLYNTWKYKKILIFANSRAACDRLFGILNITGKFKGVLELHYSNLKPAERNRAEKRFRKRSHAVCIATSTLELGIDIGDVDAVLLYEPPSTVSAFLQRIGRANRRTKEINFWGICCGAKSGDQLVRFLALLDLSNIGTIETLFPRTLPSVLCQQVISCLYEKREISLASLQNLFPAQSEIMPSIFESLEKKGWLKRTGIPGLFGGGWQYRNHLFEYKIWGNFPETEVEYVLEVSDKAVADIPQSIVSQMEAGDRLFIAGRLLEILKIDTGEFKKVLARPSTGRATKELAWIGKGPFISIEVAKAMEKIVQTGNPVDKSCLYARTKKLFSRKLKQGETKVVLENGIEVVPGQQASFCYRTFLGSAGNLVLEWSIKESSIDDDIFIESDETSLECSHWIRFEDINLPVNQKEFQYWVKRHFKILSAIIPLSMFSKALPKDLLILEMTEFLFDHRIADTFARYLESTSETVSGNKEDLLLSLPAKKNLEPEILDIIPESLQEDSLLARAKQKAKQENNENLSGFLRTDICRKPCLTPDNEIGLTATMISDYFFHAQCQRHFCFKFLKVTPFTENNRELKNIFPNQILIDRILIDQGILHEEQVLKNLKQQGANIIFMETRKSQDLRFENFLKQLNDLIATGISCDTAEKKPVFLSQCLLKADISVPDSPDVNKMNINRTGINGTGIPDLLVLSLKKIDGKKTAIIEVGDIKSSTTPRYHHKWQVAFYALLLKKILACHDIPAMVSETAFLITRSSGQSLLHEKHEFDLKAYLSAFPMLIKSISAFLSKPASDADHRLQSHCVTCDWFNLCYYNALAKQEVQFLPGLTSGELLKLREMGCSDISQTHAALEQTVCANKTNQDDRDNQEKLETGFSLQQTQQIMGHCKAFLKNRIVIRKKNTRLFPENISQIFFIHIVKDPLTGLPCVLGFMTAAPLNTHIKSHIRTMKNNQERRDVWIEFAELISRLWEKNIIAGKVPHIFHFGSMTRLDLLQWGENVEAGEGEKPGFLWQTQPSPWTDLQKLFKAHFYMPAPGVVSLYALGLLFGCKSKLDPPETLFHQHCSVNTFTDDSPDDSLDDSTGDSTGDLALTGLKSMVESFLRVMNELSAKARVYLKSQWRQEWDADFLKSFQPDTSALPFLRFIKEEQRLKENDILKLQEQTLQERILQFRAIGNLRFDHTSLDHEGRFLYIFTVSSSSPSKFREGDFLKLAPVGLFDIQEGFPVIMTQYDIEAGEIALVARSGRMKSGKMNLNKNILYSLEEDISDWNQPKLIHVANTIFKGYPPHPLLKLLQGEVLNQQSDESPAWLARWLANNDTGLNSSQQKAFALPFKYRTSLIQGPPGTGKTHLLAWILIALIFEAYENQRPLCIGVSALTHQAIETILKKVTHLVERFFPETFPGHCIKWGRTGDGADKAASENREEYAVGKIEFSDDANDILGRSWLIIGATGYGFYNLFKSKKRDFPNALDWVIFDEASQIPIPQALLSLIYGSGNYLFTGDVNQLPPIVLGDYEGNSEDFDGLSLKKSILENFQNLYPESHQQTLNTTYRMNKEICAFPGKTWYKKMLHPAPSNVHARLTLKKPLGHLHNTVANIEQTQKHEKILDPKKPVVMILTDHRGCSQKSDVEADIMAELARELIISNGLSPDQIALISPHRAQNNAIMEKLGEMLETKNLPVVDTIERIQGAERDIIIFGITSSDPDHLLSEFLNSPNRLNVAMTRAKTKLIIVGSHAFFSVIPESETILEKNSCFKQLLTHCQKQSAVFYF